MVHIFNSTARIPFLPVHDSCQCLYRGCRVSSKARNNQGTALHILFGCSFAIHIRNKILYSPYLQFNGTNTLPSSARLLSRALPSGQSKLQGKKLPASCPALLIWLLYHLLFPNSTSEKQTFISKLPPNIPWLACLGPP